MRFRDWLRAWPLVLCACAGFAGPTDGNRLTYLDGSDPYHVGLGFPRLTTPQWVGEDGVEAVVVLAIDDMRERDSARYESFLRPILNRLKAIDDRAPVSIMTCKANPTDPRLHAWLEEGVNIDVHTLAHPCPLLRNGDFEAARRTVLDCVDLLDKIPGNRPVAFRMPCCDSLNTPSPRFYAEIFNKTSPDGRHLTIDSSVFNVLTPADPSLPRELVLDSDGGERFRKYLPFPSFVNTIENYPYPYVIGKLCWEFPCIVPSDWEAQHLHKANNPRTVEDLKAALDAVVLKQGVFNLVFHPHGWIKNEQIVELIDHAVQKHGEKVKFLNFREAQERLDKNLLGGNPLRAENGRDNGVRLLDVNNDGYMDVMIGNATRSETRIWDVKTERWRVQRSGARFVEANHPRKKGDDVTDRFTILRPDGAASVCVPGGSHSPAFEPVSVHFEDGAWRTHWGEFHGLELTRRAVVGPGSVSIFAGHGLRFRDLDGDGRCEAIVGNESENAVFAWSPEGKKWAKLSWALPDGARIVDAEGRDAGLRFLDLDEDGRDDVVFSNDEGFGVYLFDSWETGWSRKVTTGKAGAKEALPKIVRNGTNNGFRAHSRSLWWQNEDTAAFPDHVDRRSYNDVLKQVEPRAKSPEASRASIRVRPGFTVETVAREPLVKDPIAFDWSADGRLWVVEMGDYPLGLDGKGKPGGVVRVLEDTNGDGIYEKSTEFLSGLGIPTGLLPWRDGVLIACAPDIFYAEDRDGDGKADVREVLFTGFKPGNPQHRLNGFDLGLDGWVYGANGDSGGLVRSTKTGKSVEIGGRDFRFRPDDGRFEAESGPTQYGRHRDDWGRWFGDNNPTWAWHFVLSDPDLRRNARFAPPDPRKVLEPDTALFPISRTLARFNDPGAANRTTSANSPTPYRDDLFGPHFENSLFVSEPVHNLVHRIDLVPDGPTFRGRRAPGELDREFLASSDNWTRPTMLKTGPDGALWVADMYRAVIEHPEWIPDDWEARLDLRAGSEQGRIYRVYPVDRKPRPMTPLDRLDTPGLVAALDGPNGWQRDTAQRLLLHKDDRASAGPLRRLARASQRPKTRVQALWTLETLNALTADSVLIALHDPHPRVRRHAVRLGERFFEGHRELSEAALALGNDPDAEVRFQLALSLGNWPGPRAGRALAGLARRDGEDSWFRAAILSSATPHVETLLTVLFAESEETPPPAWLIEPLFVLAGTTRDRRGMSGLIRALGTPALPEGRFAPWQFAALAGLLDALKGNPERAGTTESLGGLWKAARALAGDDTANEKERLAAVRLLGRDPRNQDADRDRLAGLLRPQVSNRLQLAAVAALGKTDDRKAPEALLAGWKGHSPQLRSAVLDAVLSRESWTGSLLSSLEDSCTPPAEIDPAHRRRLLDHRDPTLKARAEAIFRPATGSRQTVLDRYRPALERPADPAAGAAVFKRTCAACHKLGGEGVEVGPDLASLTDKSPESLLTAILDPNRAFEAKFMNFNVQTTDGRVLSGMIASETATAITLKRQEGKEDVLLRAEIETMAASGQSLMPEGMEKDIKPQELADLISFLGRRRK